MDSSTLATAAQAAPAAGVAAAPATGGASLFAGLAPMLLQGMAKQGGSSAVSGLAGAMSPQNAPAAPPPPSGNTPLPQTMQLQPARRF